MADQRDPFSDDREQSGVKTVAAEGTEVPLLLRLRDVKKTCKDTKNFSNDNPLMIVLHSEANSRSVRQLPIETDPPDHTEYRALVEPIFRKPKDAAYQAGIRDLVRRLVDDSIDLKEVEVVRGFALPLQSRALARLLGVADAEAEEWISWGIHVFRDQQLGPKGSELDQYILAKLEATAGSDADDFFSVLNRLEFRGRELTLEEKHGFANMAFAGGRDTVIHTVSSIVVHLAEQQDALSFLRDDEGRINTAAEEYVRFVSPLTVISRTCPHQTDIHGVTVEAGERVGLCWPSANRDATVFKSPDSVVLNRSPNPHVGYGFGVHNCLGQHQARAIIRSLLSELCDRLERVELLEAIPELEHESSYTRQVGYKLARVRFHARQP
ncbi:MAG: cytochrome P450 [Planctomycetota bacterium]